MIYIKICLMKGDIYELDERMCTHNRKVLNWMIHSIIDDSTD